VLLLFGVVTARITLDLLFFKFTEPMLHYYPNPVPLPNPIPNPILIPISLSISGIQNWCLPNIFLTYPSEIISDV